MQTPQIPVFDGHNDVVQALVSGRRGFFERSSEGHLDLPRARAGGLGGGLFAIFVRSPGPGLAAAGEPKSGPYEAPLSPTPDPEDARGAALLLRQVPLVNDHDNALCLLMNRAYDMGILRCPAFTGIDQ